jgi:glucokinase
VLFVTVGTGIGGGLAIDGNIYRGNGIAAVEVGHLRPGLDADRPNQTVEAIASGPGIVATARREVEQAIDDSLVSPPSPRPSPGGRGRSHASLRQRAAADDLLRRCGGEIDRLTAKIVAEAAATGNHIARRALADACQTLGWALAQAVTLLSPDVIVIGGGVSLMGEELFFAPLRDQVARYVFGPLHDSLCIVPAELGEAVVVHGALALAAGSNL